MKRNSTAAKIAKVCEHCEKTFFHHVGNHPRFCSRVCYWNTIRVSKGKPAECHPERLTYAKKLCGPCYSLWQRQNNKNIAPSGRRSQLYKKYGITPEQYDKTFEKQGGQCPICLCKLYKPGDMKGRKAAQVDHDHNKSSKRVRGLTCWTCNLYKIGTNTSETARRVTAYLESEFDARLL